MFAFITDPNFGYYVLGVIVLTVIILAVAVWAVALLLKRATPNPSASKLAPAWRWVLAAGLVILIVMLVGYVSEAFF
jgi:hypothetical protein